MRNFLKFAVRIIALFTLFITSVYISGADSGKQKPGTGAVAHPSLPENIQQLIEVAQTGANERWDLQKHKALVAAQTAKQIAEILKLVRKESDEYNFGIQKWDKVSSIEVEKANGYDETLEAWRDTRAGSDAEKAGAAKIDAICLEKAEKIQTLPQALDADARPGTPAYDLVIKKQYRLLLKELPKAQTIKELDELADKLPNTKEAVDLYVKCLDALALKLAWKETTLEGLEALYLQAREGSVARKIIILRAAKFLPAN